MSIFFGFSPSNENKVPQSLKDKDINLIRAAPSLFPIIVRSEIPEARLYGNFRSLFASILRSISTSRPVDPYLDELCVIGKTGYTRWINMQLPPLAVSFVQIPSELSIWLHNHGFVSQEMMGTTAFLKEVGVTVEEIAYLKSCPQTISTTRVPYTTANLQASAVYVHLMRVASLACVALQYPMWADSVGTPGSKRVRVDIETRMDVDSSDGGAPVPGPSETVPAVTPFSKFLKFPSVLASTYAGIVVNAPSDIRGPTSSLSEAIAIDYQCGHWLPFVEELATIDNAGPIRFLEKHCIPALGVNFPSALTNLESFKSGWGILKRLRCGHELAHLYRVLDVAITGGAGVRAIYTDHYYEGTILFGRHLSFSFNNRIIPALPQTELIATIRASSNHEESYARIRQLLGLVEDQSFESYADLRQIILQRPDLSASLVNNVKKHARRLRYARSVWSGAPVYLLRLFDIIKGASIVDGTVPISPECIDDDDLPRVVLSAFGKSCPSFVIPNGRQISLMKKMPVADFVATKSKKGGKRVSNDIELTVQVRMVDHVTAVEDFRKMISLTSFSVVPAQQANANNIRIYRGETRATLFAGLSSLVNKAATTSGVVEDNESGGVSVTAGGTTTKTDDMFSF
jgi:hypothetical protein